MKRAFPSQLQLKQLYDTIGDSETLLNILKDFYRRMANDVIVGFFFSGKDTNHIAARQCHFLLKVFGQIETYEGKSPTTAHIELPPILPGHFNRRLVILDETLRDFGIEKPFRDNWISLERSFEKAIVSQRPS